MKRAHGVAALAAFCLWPPLDPHGNPKGNQSWYGARLRYRIKAYALKASAGSGHHHPDITSRQRAGSRWAGT